MFSIKIPKKYSNRVNEVLPTDNDETPYVVVFRKPWVYMEEFNMFSVGSREELLEAVRDAKKFDTEEYEEIFGE